MNTETPKRKDVPLGDLTRRLLLLPFVARLAPFLRGCTSILDIGCGAQSPVAYVRTKARRVGIDGDGRSIELARLRNTHDDYIVGDVREIISDGEKYDAVLAIEIIEHLSKEDGEKFVKSLERLALKVVIITTPNGYVPQPAIDGNEFQRHLCGYSVEELQALGYRVRGINGLKELRGEYARITRTPKLFWYLISLISELYVWTHPERAFGLFAYKFFESR